MVKTCVPMVISRVIDFTINTQQLLLGATRLPWLPGNVYIGLSVVIKIGVARQPVYVTQAQSWQFLCYRMFKFVFNCF